VLIKQDGMPTYNFANVIDDHLMQISHVIRGTEYLSSTPKYNLLYRALGWDVPEYIHLPPVMRDQHHKLSKRDGDAYFSDFVSRGYLPEALINYLAFVGWNPGDEREFFTLSELQEAFSVKGINNAPAIFDIDKLTWYNFEYIRRLPFDKYLEMATPWFEKALGKDKFDLKRLAELMQIRTEVFDRIPDMVRFLAELPDFSEELYTNKKMKTNPEVALENLKLVKPVLEGISDWSEATIHDTVMPVIAEAGKKNGAVLWPMRIAISGQENTPGGAFEIAYLLGKAETLRRIDSAIARLE
jgi:glutamyl-tRNA synthetase